MQQWRQYDWTRLTTIAVWEFLDNSAELYCYAKSQGVKIVIPASPTVDVYGGSNETAKVESIPNFNLLLNRTISFTFSL